MEHLGFFARQMTSANGVVEANSVYHGLMKTIGYLCGQYAVDPSICPCGNLT